MTQGNFSDRDRLFLENTACNAEGGEQSKEVFARRPLLLTSSSYLLASGFTLMEVCIVLFIVAVLFVVAAPPAARLMQQERIEKPVRALQSFAKTARRLAMTEHRTYEVILTDNQYLLQPLTDDNREEGLDRNKPDIYQLPPDITLTIQHANESEFRRTNETRWLFSPNGLCEPIRFLFQRGKDWVKFQINPLTARIENQQSFIH